MKKWVQGLGIMCNQQWRSSCGCKKFHEIRVFQAERAEQISSLFQGKTIEKQQQEPLVVVFVVCCS
jgi:hypothetical protein